MGENNFITFTVVAAIIFICANCAAENATEPLLSRRRRYLIFPEGSSLQLVYDQIIPIVDNTNLFIMGVTVAMAWPLPDKLHRHDEEATHDHQNKTDKIVNDMSKHISFSKQSNESDCYNNCHYDSYYNRRNYHIGLSDRDYRQHLIAKTKLFNTNPWDQNYSSTNTVSSRWYRDSTQLNHYVYPALRMRRDIFLQKQTKMHQNYLHPEVKHYLNQHHASRLSLHSSIEKYLIAKGENGKQCVERAICETVQRSSTNDAPQSFLKEIMRAIFSLPTADIESQWRKRGGFRTYDDASSTVDSANITDIDCSAKYSECPWSVWSEDFSF